LTQQVVGIQHTREKYHNMRAICTFVSMIALKLLFFRCLHDSPKGERVAISRRTNERKSMADQRKLSVEEILAACRDADGEGAGAAESAASDAPAPAEPAGGGGAVEQAAPASDTPAKDARAMSVEEMLAAARAGGKASSRAEESDSPATAESAAADPVAPAKPAGQMSVEEMLAAARSGGKPKVDAATAKPAVTKKPATKKPAGKLEKPSGKPSVKADSGPKDTASILAMARKEHRPGPVSKAEAVAQGKDVAPKSKMPAMPERPAYTQPTTAAASEDRRSFFASFMGAFLGSSLAVGFSSLAVTNVLWVLGLARFMFPNILTEPPTVFKVGFPDEYGPGQVQAKYKAQFGVWVVKAEYEGQSQVYALKSVCTHLGCTPNWLEGEQKFKCPCHGSGFYKDGVNFEGPAPRPLERYAIHRADDGQLEVDKSRTFQEELGQWVDAASFVPV
jgi:cytochrome b6-f complex iron-sulfur subunit